MSSSPFRVACALLAGACLAAAQDPDSTKPPLNPASEAKRIFGIIPNFRTSASLAVYKPLTPKEKFKIFEQDAFDRGTFALAAAFAGVDQMTNASPSFGQGVAGYGRYFGASYGNFFVGDFMTEGLFPVILHQDPRYFRRGCCGISRLGYAAGQIFLTHSDKGKTQINYSELAGNSVAVAISEAYYPDNRTAANAVSSLASQLAVDMAANILKEYWPEISRKFSHKKHDTP